MKRLKCVYGWVLAVLTVLLSVAFAAVCVLLYRTGALNDAQQVYAAAESLSPWVIGYLVAVAAGVFMRMLHPAQERIRSTCLEKSAVPAAPRAVRAVLFIAAVVLIAAGVMNGGLRDVLIKAINICTECIGLG